MMASDARIRLRDRREPGHLWADNEIYDVFGDELGQGGISLYMTLARLCYGSSVQASLRGLADHARMSKDSVSRAMQTLVRVGLVIETKSGKARAVSTYSLTDAKALAREYVRERVTRTLEAQSVSVGDRCEPEEKAVTPSVDRDISYSGASDTLVSICLPQRQTSKSLEFPENSESLSHTETQLSQKTRNLSQNRPPYLNKTQDTRQVLPPTPQGGREIETADPDGNQRALWELTNRVRARERQRPIEWERWVEETKLAGAWPEKEKINQIPAGNSGHTFRRIRKRRNSEAVVGVFSG